MEGFTQQSGLSIVSLIIPQGRLHDFLKVVLQQWPHKLIHFDCRGTMVREHWIQSFLPIMNPECEYIQFLVSSEELSDFVNFCIESNELHLPGNGAIFNTPCHNFSTNAPEFWLNKDLCFMPTDESRKLPIKLKNNLYAIYALIQSGRTENAIKAAMQAGSHGPLVYFVEGRGTRDRVGWLRITKKPYEEVVMVIVEDMDRTRVKEALVSAGRVNTLGGGVVFEMAVENGLINLPTSISNKSRQVSNEQITAAIDQLMGSTDWRDTRSLSSLLATANATSEQPWDTQSMALWIMLPRKNAEQLLEQILAIGVPGANAIYTKLFSGDDAQNKKHLSIHRELVQIRMILPTAQATDFRTQLESFVLEQEFENVSFYEQKVCDVVRYQLRARESNKGRIYRGVISNSRKC